MRRKKQTQIKISYLKPSNIVFFCVLLVMFFLLIFAVTFGTKHYRNTQLGMIQESIVIVGNNQNAQFERYIEDKLDILHSLATFPEVYNLEFEKVYELFRGRSEAFGFQQFFIMKHTGTAFYIEENLYRDQKNEAFFSHVMNNDIFITEPFYGFGSTTMTLSVSIYNEKGTKVGAFCGAIDLNEIQSIFAEHQMFLDGGSYLLNRNGSFLVANESQKLHLKTSAFEDPNNDLSLITKAFTSLSNREGEIIIDGISYQAYAIYLENFDWVMVQCVETEKILYNMKYITIWTYFAYIIVILIFLCVLRVIRHWRINTRKINTDSLTGCLSRAAILNLMDAYDSKKNKKITLIYMDLNKFKYVNDTFGHDAGDDILCIFSNVLVEVFGKHCYVGRMGGDEFVILAPSHTEDEIKALCQTVQDVLDSRSQDLPFAYTIRTSYGYAIREANSPVKMNDLLTKADKYMYQCKEKMQEQ